MNASTSARLRDTRPTQSASSSACFIVRTRLSGRLRSSANNSCRSRSVSVVRSMLLRTSSAALAGAVDSSGT